MVNVTVSNLFESWILLGRMAVVASNVSSLNLKGPSFVKYSPIKSWLCKYLVGEGISCQLCVYLESLFVS